MSIYKRKWQILLYCLLAAGGAIAQKDLTGHYLVHTADTSNVLLLHLQKDSAGNYTCSYDMPLGLIINRAAKSVQLNHDTIEISLPQPVAILSAFIALDGSLQHAVWKQNGHLQPNLIQPLARPQTPHPPFPYLSDSVEYDNVETTVHLGATLTHPKGGQKFPAVILITGSGQQDRDENIFEHQFYAVVADYLSRQGIAVLRVDDRQVGKSRGDLKDATSADFAQDLLTSLAWLKKQLNIDSTKIGLIGHSEGGMLAAMAYSQWPHFAYIVSLAGTGVPGSAISLRQQTEPLKNIVSPAAFNAYYQLTQQTLQAISKYRDNDSLIDKQFATLFTNWKQQQADSVLIPLNAKLANGEQYAQSRKSLYAVPWTKYFLVTDPALYWQKVKCPVLVLNGAKDTQVDAVQNTTAIKTALQKGSNSKVSVQILPELDHLFQHCNTGELLEYALIEETFSPGALNIIGNWIKSAQTMRHP